MNEHDKAPEADATGEDELAKYWAEADAEDAKTDGDALPDRDEGSEDPDADLPPDVEDDETGRSGDQDTHGPCQCEDSHPIHRNHPCQVR